MRTFSSSYHRTLFPQYHRALGVLVWTLVTSHMVLWMIKWIMDKTLANNIFTITYLQITPENVGARGFFVPFFLDPPLFFPVSRMAMHLLYPSFACTYIFSLRES